MCVCVCVYARARAMQLVGLGAVQCSFYRVKGVVLPIDLDH